MCYERVVSADTCGKCTQTTVGGALGRRVCVIRSSGSVENALGRRFGRTRFSYRGGVLFVVQAVVVQAVED